MLALLILKNNNKNKLKMLCREEDGILQYGYYRA